MADYEFTTEWRLNAPRQAVWDLIRNPQHWPLWWRGLPSVSKINQGQPAARIDGLMLLALSYILWFGLVPLLELR